MNNNFKTIFDSNFRELLGSEIVSILGGLFAGTILAIYTDKLLLLPGMLVLLPGFLELRGNISGSFASRLSSGLFLGVINPKKLDTKIIRGNLVSSFFLVIVVTMFLGFMAFGFNYLLFHVYAPKIILLPIIAGIIANAVEVPMTLVVTMFLFRRGYDPNNIMGPFVTSTGDITSIVALLLTLLII